MNLNSKKILRRQKAIDRRGWESRAETSRFWNERRYAWAPLIKASRQAFRRALPKGTTVEWNSDGMTVNHIDGTADLYLAFKVFWRGMWFYWSGYIKDATDATAIGWRLSGALLAWSDTKEGAAK